MPNNLALQNDTRGAKAWAVVQYFCTETQLTMTNGNVTTKSQGLWQWIHWAGADSASPAAWSQMLSKLLLKKAYGVLSLKAFSQR